MSNVPRHWMQSQAAAAVTVLCAMFSWLELAIARKPDREHPSLQTCCCAAARNHSRKCFCHHYQRCQCTTPWWAFFTVHPPVTHVCHECPSVQLCCKLTTVVSTVIWCVYPEICRPRACSCTIRIYWNMKNCLWLLPFVCYKYTPICCEFEHMYIIYMYSWQAQPRMFAQSRESIGHDEERHHWGWHDMQQCHLLWALVTIVYQLRVQHCSYIYGITLIYIERVYMWDVNVVTVIVLLRARVRIHFALIFSSMRDL